MTTPGFQAQQAAQQAAARATASAAGHAQASYLAADAARHASFAARSHHRGPGPIGLLGRLVGFVFSLAIIAFAVGVFLTIIGQVDSGWPHEISTWIQNHR